MLDLSIDGRTENSKGVESRAKASLPGGVPKIIGAIHPTDFMVLLKHGYAFKDVGAESAHGEFTHRLQWYAIIQSKDALKLANKPIDLYKKMWLSGTMGTANLATGRSLYMWMALFDQRLNSDQEAASGQFKTMAHSPHTFNNPEYMNTVLTTPVYGTTNVFHANDSSNLYVLRKLLIARKSKRAFKYDASTTYHEKKMVADPPSKKTVLASNNPVQQTQLRRPLKNVVVWIESL